MAFVPVIVLIVVLTFRGRPPGSRASVGLVGAGILLSAWLYFVA